MPVACSPLATSTGQPVTDRAANHPLALCVLASRGADRFDLSRWNTNPYQPHRFSWRSSPIPGGSRAVVSLGYLSRNPASNPFSDRL